MQKAVEKSLRGLVKRSYDERLGHALSSLKGVPFPNQSARMKAARTKVGFYSDEVFQKKIGVDAAAFISTAADVQGFRARAAHDTESILSVLEALHVGDDAIAACISKARDSVGQPRQIEPEDDDRQPEPGEVAESIEMSRRLNRSRRRLKDKQ